MPYHICSLILFINFYYLIQKLLRGSVSIYLFSNIVNLMPNYQLQYVFINPRGFSPGDKGVACIMWFVSHAKALINFIEASTVFIISEVGPLLAIFVIEEVIAFHGNGFIIVAFNKFTNARVDWNRSVSPGIRLKTTGESPCININISYLQYSKLLRTPAAVYTYNNHINKWIRKLMQKMTKEETSEMLAKYKISQMQIRGLYSQMYEFED